jgi:hypothetical protein
METTAPRPLRSDLLTLSAFAALILAIHFAMGNGYGYHRDELQFLDDARHLQWGFVAYPPLTSFLARISITLFGISPQALRLPSAIINAGTLVLVGLTARELGARRAAQLLTVLVVFPLASPSARYCSTPPPIASRGPSLSSSPRECSAPAAAATGSASAWE